MGDGTVLGAGQRLGMDWEDWVLVGGFFVVLERKRIWKEESEVQTFAIYVCVQTQDELRNVVCYGTDLHTYLVPAFRCYAIAYVLGKSFRVVIMPGKYVMLCPMLFLPLRLDLGLVSIIDENKEANTNLTPVFAIALFDGGGDGGYPRIPFSPFRCFQPSLSAFITS
jgi:hypothetical protein